MALLRPAALHEPASVFVSVAIFAFLVSLPNSIWVCVR
jgi:hypothetical protein